MVLIKSIDVNINVNVYVFTSQSSAHMSVESCQKCYPPYACHYVREGIANPHATVAFENTLGNKWPHTSKINLASGRNETHVCEMQRCVSDVIPIPTYIGLHVSVASYYRWHATHTLSRSNSQRTAAEIAPNKSLRGAHMFCELARCNRHLPSCCKSTGKQHSSIVK